MSASMAEGIAEVLKTHQLANYSRERYCLCGTFLGAWANEAAHQAEVLAANGFGKLEQAWDEGYTTGNAHNGRRDANPYRNDYKPTARTGPRDLDPEAKLGSERRNSMSREEAAAKAAYGRDYRDYTSTWEDTDECLRADYVATETAALAAADAHDRANGIHRIGHNSSLRGVSSTYIE
ncbi:hypothetical protein [Arthrobacter bambusae]|uniref:Uncharacterized protein n=1 Tax=Arthrobacter bambusae TaxID=1338426 RepID=A0AAW8DEP5_9MICC|nr:hypothetical protein [Arthrobacter bambusae]MDP9903138.1 hypothetical protein [Arthrobacter bambusae]MDQ0128868.1 hypothetical protein [Arthrobacter bambusae]MDQ0180209.1 hypothetical protein [Arthrobacter bambusae]